MEDAEQRRQRDEALLKRACRQPEDRDARDAAAGLLLNYRAHVYQWCYRYVRNQEQALDLSQEVLLETYQALPSFGRQASFSSWLFAITRNRCVSELRRLS